jgi:hypothetical protein
VLGLLALPSEFSKMKSHRYGTGIAGIVLALDLGFVIAGIVMFSRWSTIGWTIFQEAGNCGDADFTIGGGLTTCLQFTLLE